MGPFEDTILVGAALQRQRRQSFRRSFAFDSHFDPDDTLLPLQGPELQPEEPPPEPPAPRTVQVVQPKKKAKAKSCFKRPSANTGESDAGIQAAAAEESMVAVPDRAAPAAGQVPAPGGPAGDELAEAQSSTLAFAAP